MKRLLLTLAVCLGAYASYAADNSLVITNPPTDDNVIGYLPPETATVNPPAIAWMPEKAATADATWNLQVAKADAKDWNSPVFDITTPWLLYTHTKVMDEGSYKWRYRFVTKDNKTSNWSIERTFTIPANTPTCPRPETSEVAKNIPVEHPHAFVRPENLQALRDSRKTMTKDWAQMQEKADKAMSTPIMKEPEAWENGKWNNQQWLKYFRQISDSCHSMENLAFAYMITNDKKYGERAKEHLMNMAGWDKSTTGTSSMKENDEVTMGMIWGCTRTYSWINDLLNETEKQAVRDIIKAKCEDGMKNKLCRADGHFEQYAFDSHNGRIWHMIGEAGIVFYHEIPEAKTWLDYAMMIFYGWYPAWGDNEGGWSEGMHYYCSYNELVTTWLEEMKTILKVNPANKPVYSSIGWQGYYMAPPGSPISLFGDFAESKPPMSRGRILAYYASLTNRGEWQWYADQIGWGDYQGWWNYLGAFREKPAPIPPKHKTNHHILNIAGYATVFSDYGTTENNVQLSMRASPRGNRSHSHQDQGAIVLGAYGDALLVNTGVRDVYGGPYCKEWYWNTLSHNTLLFDNNEGQLRSPLAKASFVNHGGTPDEPFHWFVADMSAAYSTKATTSKRMVGFYDGKDKHKGTMIAVLTVTDPKPETKSATLVWHARSPFEFSDTKDKDYWKGDFGIKAKYATLNASTYCFGDMNLQTSMTDKYSLPPDPHASTKPEWHLWQKVTWPETHKGMLKMLTVLLPQKTGQTATLDNIQAKLDGENRVVLTWTDKVKQKYEMTFDLQSDTVKAKELHR